MNHEKWAYTLLATITRAPKVQEIAVLFSGSCLSRNGRETGLTVLFRTGLRIGELLALNPSDIDLDARTLTVHKSFQSIDGKEVITEPKTRKSRRVIPLLEKLCQELKAYMDALYEPDPDDRLFPYTKSYFHRQMQAGV